MNRGLGRRSAGTGTSNSSLARLASQEAEYKADAGLRVGVWLRRLLVTDQASLLAICYTQIPVAPHCPPPPARKTQAHRSSWPQQPSRRGRTGDPGRYATKLQTLLMAVVISDHTNNPARPRLHSMLPQHAGSFGTVVASQIHRCVKGKQICNVVSSWTSKFSLH